MPPRYDDEPDLYPPDVEHVSPELRQQRLRAMVGGGLVTLGMGVLFERLLHNDLEFWLLAVGIALLVGWAKAPQFPLFAIGSIVTGFGVGELIQSLVDLRFESTLSYVVAAAGFLAVYVRYPQKGRWALIPAGIMGLLAVGDFGIGLIGLIPGAITGALLPLLLIGGGVLLMFRNRLPRPLVKCGLIAAVIVFVSSAMSSMDDWDGWDLGFGSRDLEPLTVTDLDGQILVIRSQSGRVEVEVKTLPAVIGDLSPVTVTLPAAVVAAKIDGHSHGSLQLEETDDDRAVVNISGRGGRLFRRSGSADYDVVVRTGTRLRIETSSGDVDVDLEKGDAELDIRTNSGDVTIERDDDRAFDAGLELRTNSGEIDVDGEEYDNEYLRGGDGMEISVETNSGNIELDGFEQAA